MRRIACMEGIIMRKIKRRLNSLSIILTRSRSAGQERRLKGDLMTIEWWHWAVLGVGLMVAELLLPAFVLVWFGLGALAGGAGGRCCSRISASPRKFLSGSSARSRWSFCGSRCSRPAHHKTLIGRSSAEAIGEVGLLVGDVGPFQKSQVRFQKPLFGSDVWECIADETIGAGERVKVVSVEGSLLKITKTGGH